METPKVYIVNLNSYNNARTRGGWYDLPVDIRQVQRDLKLNEDGEEYAIHDYENFYGYKVGEYSSLQELHMVMYEIFEEDRLWIYIRRQNKVLFQKLWNN